MVKRIIAYYIFCFLLWVCAVLNNSYELWAIVVLMVCMPIFMSVILFLARKRIKLVPIIHKERVCIDEDIKIEIEIDNRSLLPVLFLEVEIEDYNSFYKISKTERLEITTLKYGKQTFTFMIKSKYCGNVCVSVNEIKIKDYLKMIKIRTKTKTRINIPVLPRIIIPESEIVQHNAAVVVDSDVFSKTEKGSDPSEVFDYRKYVQGDELNTINWKLSARCDEYIVKEFSKPINSGIVIMLELYVDKTIEDKTKYIDGIVTTAIGMSMKLLELGHEHNIVWYDESREMCMNQRVEKDSAYMEILELIYNSSIYSDKVKVLDDYYTREDNRLETHIYYIGAFYNEQAISTMISDRENAIKRYIFVTNENFDKQEVENAELNDVLLQTVKIDDMENSVAVLQF